MSKINTLLSTRFKQKFSKMAGLGEAASKGNLSSFSGIFRISSLSKKEMENLGALLDTYKHGSQRIEGDLELLAQITAEVRAINNQAAILHGERIKKAQEILKKYREGAFTLWLITTYGNRQTPYNLLYSYELYQQIPSFLRAKLDEMPRQVVYTLATRVVPLEKKEEFIKNHAGQTKAELLNLLRKKFPLPKGDQRAEDVVSQTLLLLNRLLALMGDHRFNPNSTQKKQLQKLLEQVAGKV